MRGFLFAILTILNANCLVFANNNINFAPWIERSCKPLDKGKLTALPRFSFSQQNLKMSAMLKFEELPEVNSERWLSLEDFEGEVWMNVAGYEGLYEVSNYGRLKSLQRSYPHLGGYRTINTKICKLQLDKKTGYYKFILNKNYYKEEISIHRLVARTFIPNDRNLPFVNHKDEIRIDNCVQNLEWCTPRYNLEYSNVFERAKEKLFKRVVQIDKDGNVVNRYNTTGEAAKAIGLKGYSSIALCCKGKIGSVKGYLWRYEGFENIPHKKPRHRRVIKKSLSGEYIETYDSIASAGTENRIEQTSILNCCKGKYKQAGGFAWEYKDNYDL